MSCPGFFTRGFSYELPHPSIEVRLILLVHAAIERGLQYMVEAGFAFASAHENDITRELELFIVNRVRKYKEIAGFDRRTFGKISRAPEVRNVDGKHPDKKPDLVFDINREVATALDSHDALFVECKPVDKEHSAGQDYCDAGLVRFVNGDYAWTMKEAMMVAYVRDGRSISKSLLPALAPRKEALGLRAGLRALSASRATPKSEMIQVSVHARAFLWPEGKGQACDIRIFHSWHSCG
jgi:hypothetical protein